MTRRWLCLILLCSIAWPARGDVTVVCNRTRGIAPVTITPTGGKPYTLNLASGQVTPLFSDAALHASYQTPAGMAGFELEPGGAYYFGETPAGPQLHQIGLGERESVERVFRGGGATPAGVVNVRICVDEEQPLRREVWSRTLRARVDAASRILLSHTGITFRVVATGEWNSDNAQNVFEESLAEFEKEVPKIGDTLVIGFTSQYQLVSGRTHLGGTRGPLSSHILLREWSQHVSESERLELLVHELGHYLGACHSPESDSVMRPVLGDRQSRQASFDVRFDPVNTLIMSMVGEELRRRGVRRFNELSPPTRARLNQVYTVMAQAMPGDTSAAGFAARTQGGVTYSEVDMIALVMKSITDAGLANERLPDGGRLTGDDLTEELVRRAAAAAAGLRDRAPRALLLALGVALDDTVALRGVPATGALAREVDPPGALERRAGFLRGATMCGRADHLKHFFISAALTAATDARQAEGVGLAKEMVDANRQSGFSFADLAADRAGIRFARAVLSGELTPVDLANDFGCYAFMPHIDGLPEGLTAQQFLDQYGGTTDERYLAMIREIDSRLDELTGYSGQ